MFTAHEDQRFTLGVNYWPRRKAMDWWKGFDPGEVADEFSLISELGLDMVRIFLLWEDFQPTPDAVAPGPLRDLVTVAEIASTKALTLNVTFFTGHMSGPNWAPPWLLAGPSESGSRPMMSRGHSLKRSIRNPYVDPVALEAEQLLLNAVATRLKGHSGVGLYNLGNEPDLFSRPPNAALGLNWARRMRDTLQAIDDKVPVSLGQHAPNLAEDCGLRVDHIQRAMDVAVMHGYSIYTKWLHDPLDSDFVPFLCALTQALCGKPVLMEEFGGCTNAPGKDSERWQFERWNTSFETFVPSEQSLAEYLSRVLDKLLWVGASGALLWCFADYHESLWDRPPCDESLHERHFGLIRPDGSLKPHAEVIKAFAARAPMQRPSKSPLGPIDGDTYYEAPLVEMQRLYARYKNMSSDRRT